jgi:mRNA-degrading endonuclease YafQ of YafQ-DinJ toxin-antitoxin module
MSLIQNSKFKIVFKDHVLNSKFKIVFKDHVLNSKFKIQNCFLKTMSLIQN